MTTIYDAITFAAHAHRNQRRKNADAIPYINHPLSVMRRVSQVCSDPDILSAAVLHDVVEDCNVTSLELEKRFGAKVARYVDEVTDNKSLPKLERKRLQIVNAPGKSHGGKLIKLADKTDNIYSIYEAPPLWTPSRQLKYIDWCTEVVVALGPVDLALMEQFEFARNLALSKVDAQVKAEMESVTPMDDEFVLDEC